MVGERIIRCIRGCGNDEIGRVGEHVICEEVEGERGCMRGYFDR